MLSTCGFHEREGEQACWRRRRDGGLFAYWASSARRASSRALGASVNGQSVSNTGSHRGVCIALLGHQGVIVWPGLVQNPPHPERPQSGKVLASSIWVSNMWRGPHPSRNLGCLEEMSDRTKESKPNQARQPTSGERFAVFPAPATRRGCAYRSASFARHGT